MSPIRYAPAGPADDEALRALLHEVDMPGWVRMAMAREPSYFSGCGRFGKESTFIAYDGALPAGMFASAVQPVHVDGTCRMAGYLGSLRIRPAYRHRVRLLRKGFSMVRQALPPEALHMCYTAIGADNHPARRVLEAGLPGLPAYHYLNDLVTLVMPRSRRRHHDLWQPLGEAHWPEIGNLHAGYASRYQFSPALSMDVLKRLGLAWHGVFENRTLVACLAIWDRQQEQQIRVQGYAHGLRLLRPAYNLWAKLAGRVALPAPGQALDHSYAAFLAVGDGLQMPPAVLLEDALALCSTGALSLGLHDGHAWLPQLLRHFRPVQYRTRLYAVDFGQAMIPRTLPAQPEIAVM